MLRKIRALLSEYPAQFWLVAAGLLISAAGSSLIWPFQFIYINKVLQTDLSVTGSLISISTVVGMATSFVGGAATDRFGRKPMMVLAQLLHAGAYLLMSHADSYITFLIPMSIIGASMPLYAVGSDAMMADLIPSEKRARAFSLLRMVNNAGIAIGPGIGGVIISNGSYQLAFYGAAAAMFFYSLFLLMFTHETLSRQPVHHTESQSFPVMLAGYITPLRDTVFMQFFASITLGLIAPLLMWMLLAIYTNTQYGIQENLYSWLPVTNALMCVFVQLPVTHAVRRFSPLSASTLGMLIYAVGVGSVALMSSFWGFWLSMVLMTFGELILMPTASKYVADLAPEHLRGRYMSVYWMSWGIARAIAPSLGGFLGDTFAPQAIWIGGFALGLASAIAIFTIRSQVRQKRIEIGTN